MSKFADILPIIGRSFPLLLTYAVPPELAERLEVGAQVLVPLAGRSAAGYIIALHDDPPPFENVRAIEVMFDSPPAFSAEQLELARWIADYYCASLAQSIRPFLSEMGAVKVRRWLKLTEVGVAQAAEPTEELTEEIKRALHFFLEHKGKTSRNALASAVGANRLGAVLKALKEKCLIEERAQIISLEEGQEVDYVSLAVPPDIAYMLAGDLAKKAPKQAVVLNHLADLGAGGEATMTELIYKVKSSAPVRTLAKKEMVKIRCSMRWRTPWPDAFQDYPNAPTLTPEQQAAADEICQAVRTGDAQPFLLFGVTGSGKTEIFLRAAAQALAQGKQTLLLVPEISLTAQVVGLLRARFGGQVAVIHSALSEGERRDEKERVRLGEAQVVVGPRSALFAPFSDLGLVVVDEEHDGSYKQDQEPRYHARDAALKLAQLYGCPTILASATPALESFYKALLGDYRLLRLAERPEGRALPTVHLLDLRGKARRMEILLPELQDALTRTFASGGQAMLFLNRRGHSTFLFCSTCGHSFRCPHCQVALIYHMQGKNLRCHHCDYLAASPSICPNCMGTTLRLSGYGTQKVAEEMARLFPESQVGRMDRDTTTSKSAHLRLISDFRTASTDVLVGTQMISKGLDFPGVTVVGIVAADMSLNMPDFRASERTFQLLTHMAGRAGRGDEPGEVFIQTYSPENFAIQTASRHDYEAFYEEELRQRQEAGYPPFSYLASVTTAAASAPDAQEHAVKLATLIRSKMAEERLEILGPAAAPLAKLKDRFRYHFLLRTGEPGLLQAVLRPLQQELTSRGKIHVAVDIDPVSLM